eukprot:TRINITY_DN922_c0_g1_i1.p1 TRINITY_DN922_c0_g1~~TRINITY_DN922_c0_g1_i1.p1  ORF type:complete len:157 (+),score=24.78 TRINITY_DN922_c0_g1_i1:89-559(+)
MNSTWTSVDAKQLDPPIRLLGTVVKGYGRGSKQLGYPTANFDSKAVNSLTLPNGVYYGFARVGNESDVSQMVMSIGSNPQFDNKEKSVEVHILKQYEQDFYGEELRVIIIGYIRDMLKFTGLPQLIDAINKDIQFAKEVLKNKDLLKRDHFIVSEL